MHKMKNSRNKSIKLTKRSILNIIIFLVLLYFIFHSIYGGRGLIAYFTLQSELEHAKETLEILRHDRLEIENRTKLLRPGSMDRDMLDEKIRSVLGFSKESEKIFAPGDEDDDMIHDGATSEPQQDE